MIYIGIITVYYISYVSVEDLHVIQETIMGTFTQQTFHSLGAIKL